MKQRYKHPLYRIRGVCYMDKKEFGQSKLLLSQEDIGCILNEHKIRLDNEIYIIPEHPREPLSKTNAVCVDKKQKAFLMALWRIGNDEVEYTKTIREKFKK